jgi:uncharacterized membrane protein
MPSAAPQERRPPLHRLVRAIKVRPRLVIATLIGIAVALLPLGGWRMATRLLVGWDIAVGLYLILALNLMTGADIAAIRQRAIDEDEGRITVLVITAAAALASLGAILAEIGIAAGGSRDPAGLGLAVLTIILSWALIHVVFALHYAHDFYDSDRKGKQPPLDFPGDPEPVYSDFLYFSFVVGMTAQVSDVAVRDKAVRRIVTAHAIIAFFFNAALLALVVNIAGTAILGPDKAPPLPRAVSAPGGDASLLISVPRSAFALARFGVTRGWRALDERQSG